MSPLIRFPGNLETVETVAQLRALKGGDLSAKATVLTQGRTVFGDGLGTVFIYDPASLAVDDSTTIIRPSSILSNNPGRWLQVSASIIPGGFSNRTSTPSVSFTFPFDGGGRASVAGNRFETAFTASGTKPIFGSYLNYTTNFGAGSVPYQVGEFVGLRGQAGSGNFYAVNYVAQMDAGNTGQSFTTMEVNANNFNQHYGDAAGDNDPVNGPNPWGTLANWVGTGDHRFMSALGVYAPAAAGQIYNRGLTIAGNCIRLNDIDLQTNSPTPIRIAGTHGGAGIDMSSASLSNAILVPNEAKYLALNSASGLAELFRLTSSNLLVLGVGASGGIVFSQVLLPSADNARDIGSSGLRVANAYAKQVRPGSGAPIWTSGTGTPQGVVAAPVGSLFTREDGGTTTTLYVKETGGATNTGWVAK